MPTITKTPKHSWTGEEIKTLAKLWDTHNVEQIAEELGLTPLQVNYMANEIRKTGYALPKKRRRGMLQALIRETLNVK